MEKEKGQERTVTLDTENAWSFVALAVDINLELDLRSLLIGYSPFNSFISFSICTVVIPSMFSICCLHNSVLRQ